ncbi:hypothetical protein MHIB_01710 [Mycolicibacter hiberniae]|uniref:Uncharacterized protein n=1 Tax=Mycolicibacter hiberniae TaxID=29314 RepID=A0A7I7WYZ1_9MYCO|nr:hypothetical protein MHIB_01710 [Mycolicibacter hiberniae]
MASSDPFGCCKPVEGYNLAHEVTKPHRKNPARHPAPAVMFPGAQGAAPAPGFAALPKAAALG